MPLYRRLPKRGFKNIFAKEYSEVNVEQLNRFEDNAVVDPVALVEAGILKNVLDGVRVLGSGELSGLHKRRSAENRSSRWKSRGDLIWGL